MITLRIWRPLLHWQNFIPPNISAIQRLANFCPAKISSYMVHISIYIYIYIDIYIYIYIERERERERERGGGEGLCKNNLYYTCAQSVFFEWEGWMNYCGLI